MFQILVCVCVFVSHTGSTLSCTQTNVLTPIPSSSNTIIPIQVSVTNTPITNQNLDPSFTGLSYTKQTMCELGYWDPLIGLFKALGTSGSLRLCADTTVWNQNGPGFVNGQISPPDVDRLASFLRTVNWTVIYGLNYPTSTPALAAAEVAYVTNALGKSLYAFQIGNEPDEYPTVPFASAAVFLSGWYSFYQQMIASVPQIPMAGPDSSHNTPFTTAFANNVTSRIRLLTQHYYIAEAGTPAATMSAMLASDPGNPAWSFSAISALVNTSIVDNIYNGFRVTETNSFWNGGQQGVSNAFGSALWVLRHLFTLASLNATGANIHGGGGATYTPIYDTLSVGGSTIIAQPIYYGMFLFSQAAKGYLMNSTSTVNPYFSSYSVLAPDGSIATILLNTNDTMTMNSTIYWPSPRSSAWAVVLTAPSLYALSGVTIGGASIGPDGSWNACQNYTIPVNNGYSLVNVPPASAVLVKAV